MACEHPRKIIPFASLEKKHRRPRARISTKVGSRVIRRVCQICLRTFETQAPQNFYCPSCKAEYEFYRIPSAG